MYKYCTVMYTSVVYALHQPGPNYQHHNRGEWLIKLRCQRNASKPYDGPAVYLATRLRKCPFSLQTVDMPDCQLLFLARVAIRPNVCMLILAVRRFPQ